jgi:vacuolar-type H+-ATPase subunit H
MASPRVNPRLAKTLGQQDQRSRSKAEQATERTNQQIETTDSEAWPRGVNGAPMVKILMTASELIPTGQYANVSVGPAQITAFVDPDRVTVDEDGREIAYFSEEQRGTLAKALNELAEIVESDVVAVQRNLVLESLQDSNGGN